MLSCVGCGEEVDERLQRTIQFYSFLPLSFSLFLIIRNLLDGLLWPGLLLVSLFFFGDKLSMKLIPLATDGVI